MLRVFEALQLGKKQLENNGISGADWNAERILSLSLQVARSQLYAGFNRELTTLEEEQYRSLLSKRAKHYPLAYLEGIQEFYGRDFIVDESVLIPRPETEEIIRAVLGLSIAHAPLILDLGSGSGCIPITLKHERPDSFCVGLEKSKQALKILQVNSSGTINIVMGDYPMVPLQNSVFDLITANPPYVEEHEYSSLPEETKWEPRAALVTESLEDTYETILNQGVRALKPGGYLIFEIGFGQSERIQKICETYPAFKILEIKTDHQSIPRVFVLQKL